METNHFGSLVKALRTSNLNEDGKTWTRNSFSEAIGLTPGQLGRLERGDRKSLDNNTLDLMAQALNLTSMETKELFMVAVGMSDERLYGETQPKQQLQALADYMEQISLPAFIIDVYADFIAFNQALLKLFAISPEIIDYAKTLPAGQNMLHFLYAPDFGFRDVIGPSWRNVVLKEIYLFRRSSFRYRHTAYFKNLIRELLKIEPFAIDWYASQRLNKHYNLRYAEFSYIHPRFGPVHYLATETIVNTRQGDLYLVIYNPLDADTKKIFANLLTAPNNETILPTSWPEKTLL